jgi:hypothetical protein
MGGGGFVLREKEKNESVAIPTWVIRNDLRVYAYFGAGFSAKDVTSRILLYSEFFLIS